MEYECTLHNSIVLAIVMPNIIKLCKKFGKVMT